MTATLTPSTAVPFEASDNKIAGLSLLLPGRVADATHPEWEIIRRGWALAVDQQPVAVVTVGNLEDVQLLVSYAAGNGLTVSVQPVGHGATEALNGTVLVRTRELNSIYIDTDRKVARVGSGVKWGELLAQTSPLGLAGLAGSSPDPSVTGFSLNGGLSWFSRTHGLAAHSILAIELVDATGAFRRVTADSDPDLFWAIRGGGGLFGIVTALEIQLFDAPKLYGGRLLWPMEMAYPVLRTFRQICQTAPDELTLWTHLLRFPPLPDLPEFLRGRSFVSVEATFLGAADEAAELLAPLREIPALVLDTMAEMPVAELGAIAAEPVDPMPSLEFAELMTDFDDAALTGLLDAVGPQVQTPVVAVQLRHLGGALRRADDQEGPVGPVAEPYQLFVLGVPMTADMAAGILATFDAVARNLSGHLAGACLPTFAGSNPDMTRSYRAESLSRLAGVKAAVDPAALFRSNRVLPGC